MHYDTIILGAGAAGMMCAAHTGARTGGRTLILDHAKSAGEKIRISGGGRCNFTNLHTTPENFLSQNPHFCKSALKRYTQWDFIDLISRHNIAYHEKTLGQLFCDASARDIVTMLRAEMAKSGAELRLNTSILHTSHDGHAFVVETECAGTRQTFACTNLVLATGGKSIPKMGATGLAYDIARQFNLPLTDTRPGLVPFTFSDNPFTPLAGAALPVRATTNSATFDEAMLFTHRGLSGPAMLQISSYWQAGDAISINLMPDGDPFNALKSKRKTDGRRNLSTILGRLLPAKLADFLAKDWTLTGNLGDQSDAALQALSDSITNWQLRPTGTEGYRTAEVTVGGIDTAALSSRTMQTNSVPGLYVIGEAVDVTGWLGGYNFQWAWSSGWAAGTAIAEKSATEKSH